MKHTLLFFFSIFFISDAVFADLTEANNTLTFQWNPHGGDHVERSARHLYNYQIENNNNDPLFERSVVFIGSDKRISNYLETIKSSLDSWPKEKPLNLRLILQSHGLDGLISTSVNRSLPLDYVVLKLLNLVSEYEKKGLKIKTQLCYSACYSGSIIEIIEEYLIENEHTFDLEGTVTGPKDSLSYNRNMSSTFILANESFTKWRETFNENDTTFWDWFRIVHQNIDIHFVSQSKIYPRFFGGQIRRLTEEEIVFLLKFIINGDNKHLIEKSNLILSLAAEYKGIKLSMKTIETIFNLVYKEDSDAAFRLIRANFGLIDKDLLLSLLTKLNDENSFKDWTFRTRLYFLHLYVSKGIEGLSENTSFKDYFNSKGNSLHNHSELGEQIVVITDFMILFPNDSAVINLMLSDIDSTKLLNNFYKRSETLNKKNSVKSYIKKRENTNPRLSILFNIATGNFSEIIDWARDVPSKNQTLFKIVSDLNDNFYYNEPSSKKVIAPALSALNAHLKKPHISKILSTTDTNSKKTLSCTKILSH